MKWKASALLRKPSPNVELAGRIVRVAVPKVWDRLVGAGNVHATGFRTDFDGKGRVLASTLGDAAPGALSGAAGRSPRTLRIGGADYVMLARPLHPETAGPPASVIVMHPLSAGMQTLSAIQAFLVGLAVGSVLLAVGLSFWVARTVTRPLARITDHMRQVTRSGDLTSKLTLTEQDGWSDEDAQVLARTFNSLTEAITRFQREAAQRERLSALGRLSTVIAHVVRNPLIHVSISFLKW